MYCSLLITDRFTTPSTQGPILIRVGLKRRGGGAPRLLATEVRRYRTVQYSMVNDFERRSETHSLFTVSSQSLHSLFTVSSLSLHSLTEGGCAGAKQTGNAAPRDGLRSGTQGTQWMRVARETFFLVVGVSQRMAGGWQGPGQGRQWPKAPRPLLYSIPCVCPVP